MLAILPPMLFPLASSSVSAENILSILVLILIQTICVLAVSIAVFALLVDRPLRQGKVSKAVIKALFWVSILNLVLIVWFIVMPPASQDLLFFTFPLLLVQMSLACWPVVLSSLFFIGAILVVIPPTRWKHLQKEGSSTGKFIGVAILMELCLTGLPGLISFLVVGS